MWFYDLEADPSEQRNAPESFPGDDARLEKALREHLLATEITKTRRQQRRMHDRLQALGYIE